MLASVAAALQLRYQAAVHALPAAVRRSTSSIAELPLSFPTICVWGSNTGVGKTLFSAGTAAACVRAELLPFYLKPVQTGFPLHSDARLVAQVQGCEEAHAPHAAALLSPQPRPRHAPRDGSAGRCTTLFAWEAAVSPHLAVELEGRGVPDSSVVGSIAGQLATLAAQPAAAAAVAILETAGGVCSPGPSGTLQCDLLRPLRLPGLLIGDGRLGGISATVAAYEALALRGYDVPAVALMDCGMGNAAAIERNLDPGVAVMAFPPCEPPAPAAAAAHAEGALGAGSSWGRGGGVDANLADWLLRTQGSFDQLLSLVAWKHAQRVAALRSAAGEARDVLWWPFTQHGSLGGGAEAVTVIDSRSGEHFSVFQPDAAGSAAVAGPSLSPQYDACASWWTQGVSGAAQPALARAVGRAAARYGHVIFPQNVHEPALRLAKALLHGAGAGWAQRAFFSDNGSTAVEVALKMAFRKFMVDHGVLEEGSGKRLEVVGLREAYHGDTLGTMEAVAPSPFNGRLQTPWYSGRGLFLDPPTVAMRAGGAWRVRLPASLQHALRGASGAAAAAAAAEMGSAAAVFAEGRRGGALEAAYRAHVEAAMDAHVAGRQGAADDVALGACILEPAVQGAGGMRLVDPLFQRAMAAACRARRIPVIFDEVFTGFWRLGARTAAELLGERPDVACYAKLMTGGVVPLAATLATAEVFRAFEGDSKAYALLHGHSYTAHPIGCSAALQALESYASPGLNPNLCTPAAPGRCARGGACAAPCGAMLEMWDPAGVRRLADHPRVESALPLGTLLALELRGAGAGYASEGAAQVVSRLRARGVYTRPLGNVVYLMVTPMTARRQCDELLGALHGALHAER